MSVGNSALYKHYKSKQEIFEAIVERCRRRFLEKSKAIQSKAKEMEQTENGADLLKLEREMKEICLFMYEFQTEDA